MVIAQASIIPPYTTAAASRPCCYFDHWKHDTTHPAQNSISDESALSLRAAYGFSRAFRGMLGAFWKIPLQGSGGAGGPDHRPKRANKDTGNLTVSGVWG